MWMEDTGWGQAKKGYMRVLERFASRNGGEGRVANLHQLLLFEGGR